MGLALLLVVSAVVGITIVMNRNRQRDRAAGARAHQGGADPVWIYGGSVPSSSDCVDSSGSDAGCGDGGGGDGGGGGGGD